MEFKDVFQIAQSPLSSINKSLPRSIAKIELQKYRETHQSLWLLIGFGSC